MTNFPNYRFDVNSSDNDIEIGRIICQKVIVENPNLANEELRELMEVKIWDEADELHEAGLVEAPEFFAESATFAIDEFIPEN